WATGKITEKPEKWVIEKDESNPIWKEFCIQVNNGKGFFGQNHKKFYHSNDKRTYDILDFEGYQYLTLEQWKHFFGKPKIEPPKVGDMCILRNGDKWIIRPYIESDELVVKDAVEIDTSKSLDEIIKEFGL